MLGSLALTTDFSEASRAAFGPAADLARRFNASLHLLHVAQRPQIFTPWQIQEESPEEARRRHADLHSRLEDLAAREERFRGLRVGSEVLEGESAEAIGHYLREKDIPLIVIATHGFSGLRQFPLGSFTAKVIQLSTCPVLVFRTYAASVSRKAGEFNPTRILAPCDFSPPSVHGLKVAAQWARAFMARVEVLSVVEPRPLVSRIGDGSPALGSAPNEEEEDGAIENLRALAADVMGRVECQAVVRRGHPVVEILKEIDAYRPGLVIMASRGLCTLQELALGSVAERTICGANCPVLVLR